MSAVATQVEHRRENYLWQVECRAELQNSFRAGNCVPMFEELARKNFKAIVAAYRKASGRSETALSKDLYGNTTFLAEFFAGRQSVSLKKMGEMLDLLRDTWPAEAEWPYCPAIFFRGPARGNLSPKKRKAA